MEVGENERLGGWRSENAVLINLTRGKTLQKRKEACKRLNMSRKQKSIAVVIDRSNDTSDTLAPAIYAS